MPYHLFIIPRFEFSVPKILLFSFAIIALGLSITPDESKASHLYLSKLVKMKRVRKLSDEQFYLFLRTNGGVFSRTAKAIRDQLGIEYSRQSVRERATRNPELLDDINEEVIDQAENCLYSLLESKNDSIRLRSAEFILKTKGHPRGYADRMQPEVKAENTIPIERAFLDFLLECLDRGLSPEEALHGLRLIEDFPTDMRTRVANALESSKQKRKRAIAA